jgi:hypothetical protein
MKWLHSTFTITQEEAKSENNEAFIAACRGGLLSVAQWLHSTFVMTEAEAKVYKNEVFRLACYYGHLSIAQWLHSTFAITPEEVQNFEPDKLVSDWFQTTFTQ